MNPNNRPIAFVAMQFDSDHWRDKRYVAIREELENAGFSCIRADELKTSGPVVDEVCRLLREAALVVIDSSGTSHSVSYEIGYCHGIQRDPEKTLLLRADAKLPFNYQHYRHRIYKDIRHLRRLIRDYLQIFEPLSDDQYGYTFTFAFPQDAGYGYILDGASCIFGALTDKRFSGRCECYSAENFRIPGRFFSVGVMLRNAGRNSKPSYEWWTDLTSVVSKRCVRYKGVITLQTDMSELADKRTMKEWLLPCGIAEFSDGKIIRILGENEESFFVSYQKRQQEHT